MTSKFDTSIDGISPRKPEKVALWGPLPCRAGRRPDEDKAMYPMAVLHREVRASRPPSENPDQMKLIEAERIEQVEIVHDVVMKSRTSPDRSSPRQKPG